jgi:hypothetical protein
MKKIMIIFVLFIITFSFVGCASEDELSPAPLICGDDEYISDGVCVPKKIDVEKQSHADYLKEHGKEISFSDIQYNEMDKNYIDPDYSDDQRELINSDSINENDVITFEDPSFNELVRLTLGFEKEQDILYSDILTITELRASNYHITDISSIKGIEIFRNLEKLSLIYNGSLGSVNGIQKLPKLSSLNLWETSVKKISYYSDSIEYITLHGTEVNFKSSSDFIDAISGFRNLISVRVTNTNIVFDDLSILHEYFSSLGSESGLMFDTLNIDFSKVNIRDIFYSNGEYILRRLSIYNQSLVNKNNDTFHKDYDDGLNAMYDEIGVTDNMSELTKIILIYDFVFNKYKDVSYYEDPYDPAKWSISNVTTLDKIFKDGYAPTIETVPFILKALLKKAGVMVYTGSIFYTCGNLETKEATFAAHVRFLTVKLSNGQKFMIHITNAIIEYQDGEDSAYDRFLIGSETLNTIMYNKYIVDMDIPVKDEFFHYIDYSYATINPGDVPREDIIENLPEGMSVK